MRLWRRCSLLQIELPAYTVRLTDGGVIFWGSAVFRGRDPVWGCVVGAEKLTEGVGNEVPAFSLTMAPDDSALPGDLMQPGFQLARVRYWIADWDYDTCAVTGTPSLLFDGRLDQVELRRAKDSREVEASVVSAAERLFAARRGNGLSPTFHKSVWPGETGHDGATGLSVPRAWGVEAPPASAKAGSFSGFGGFGGLIPRDMR